MRFKKIFGIGLPKTGTTTLGRCFLTLGFSRAPYDIDFVEKIVSGDLSLIKDMVESFDSFEDWPWPLLYKEINEKYPDSGFILTLRKNPEVWIKSVQKHTKRNPNPRSEKLRLKIFGFTDPWNDVNEFIRFYEYHWFQVIEYFKKIPDKLLVVSWEDGYGWKELCSFLEIEFIPQIPFPHENPSSTALSAKKKQRFLFSYIFRKLSRNAKKIWRG